jgi:alpha-tubulin suppressor-like RCC1 family protein
MRRPWGWIVFPVLAGCANLAGLNPASDGGTPDQTGDAPGVEAAPSVDSSTLDSTVRADGVAPPDTTPPLEAATDTEGQGDVRAADAEGGAGQDATLMDGGLEAEAALDTSIPDGSVPITVTVTGLAMGATLVLADNGGDRLTVQANGTDAFTTPQPIGSAYAVTIVTPPSSPPELCAVANGSGTVSANGGSNVAIACDTAVAVGAGESHTCALLKGGTVDCWGDNSYLQLGSNGSASSTPTSVSGLFGVTQIAVGTFHACAIVSSGAVYCWGAGGNGQLGNGGVANVATPIAVGGLTAEAIAAGGTHTCAITASSHEVVCWGDNASGELGNGGMAQSNTPVPVVGGAGDAGVAAIAIAAGAMHTCAVLAGGSMECWGGNPYGQVGNGSVGGAFPSPVAVSGISDAIQVSAGLDHTCAVLSSGGVACWGADSNGELGNNAVSTGTGTPQLAATPSAATSVSCGAVHTCAVLANGGIACWGFGGYGQLGDGNTPTAQSVPTLVAGLTGATAIAAGQLHSCAVVDGGVKCWGYDDYGQLGDGFALGVPTPTPVAGIGAVTGIAAGEEHTCALIGDGSVECWGYNLSGQLGDDGYQSSSTPVPVAPITGGVTQVAAGGNFACALTESGAVDCWGEGTSYQLGNGSNSQGVVPAPVPGIATVTTIALGGSSACALLPGGALDCWGGNANGQQGNGTTNDVTTPSLVTSLDGGTVQALALGYADTCVLLAGGTVDCWGADYSGQLGNNEVVPQIPTPSPVDGLYGVTQVTAGSNHTCALLNDGGVDCWGGNFDGQLGDGNQTQIEVPNPVPGLGAATSVIAGWYHTCAIVAGGDVSCWGANDFGQLGTGTISPYSASAAAVPGLHGVVALAAGGGHTCAVLSDGGVDCWGWNGNGQVGNGVVAEQNSPVPAL